MKQLNKSIERQEYLKALDIIKRYKDQCKMDLSEIEDLETYGYFANQLLSNVNLSIRFSNVIKSNYSCLGLSIEPKVIDLCKVSLRDLKKCRGFGWKCECEFLDLCEKSNIKPKR